MYLSLNSVSGRKRKHENYILRKPESSLNVQIHLYEMSAIGVLHLVNLLTKPAVHKTNVP